MICLFLGWSLHEVGLNMSVGRNCCTGDDRDGREESQGSAGLGWRQTTPGVVTDYTQGSD